MCRPGQDGAAGNSFCEGPKYERIWNVLEMEGFYCQTEQRCLSVFSPADILSQVFLVTGTTVCVIECIKTPCARWVPVALHPSACAREAR